jgi:hypothetical protein
MNLSYKDLVFESNKTENHMMDLCMLPTDINLRCSNVKMTVVKPQNSNKIYFPLSRTFDIFFSINSITNSEHIIKKELCYFNGLEPIKEIEFNSDINLPLYIHQFLPFCIKVEYDDIANMSQEIVLMFDAGLLQNKYRNDRTINFV